MGDYPNNVIYGAASSGSNTALLSSGSKVYIRNSQIYSDCRDNDIIENVTYEECAILCRDSLTCQNFIFEKNLITSGNCVLK